jgi:hypothetical protein
MPGEHALNKFFRDGIFLKKQGKYLVAEYLFYYVVIGDFLVRLFRQSCA